MTRILIAFIKAYQLALSPLYGLHCRFTPTCSQYAIESLQNHGAFRGGLLAIKRLSHCHPWHVGGHDPVP